MKHIRMFENAEQAATILQTLEYNTLSAIRGGSGISLKPGVPGPKATPFYIENPNNSSISVKIKKSGSSAPNVTVYKSTDGATWESVGATSTSNDLIIDVNSNSKIYLRCKAASGKWGADESRYNYIYTTSRANVGGNIMSLLYGNEFNGQTEFPSGSTYTFYSLFNPSNSTIGKNIVDASNLLLPATVLKDYCYCYMFYGNSFLTAAPKLPATTLASHCYDRMFANCTSLTNSPALPTTTLVDFCYCYMFNGCTLLTSAPELPATSLVQGCYAGMFYQCTGLNRIKCLATDISAANCTNSWVSRVAASGTFVKAASMSGWTTDTSGIPSGWTVEDAA